MPVSSEGPSLRRLAAPLLRAYGPGRERLSRFSQLFGSFGRAPAGRDMLSFVAVASLDQLYAQAFVVVAILDACCRRWCEASGGCLHYEHTPLPEPSPGALAALADGGLFEALRGSRLEGWVRCGCIKDPARAVHKIRSCYGGDVSRLGDVCRHRLFFDSPAQMEECVRRMRADPGVSVLRLRGASAGDVPLFGGFRVRC